MITYSVALCTYNGEKFLAEQIESILTQTVQPSEIIISDDNSNDNTVSIVSEFIKKHPSIKWEITINEKKLGYVKNFQKAILKCSQPIIFLCDQDDVWLTNKAETILFGFKDENILAIFSDAYIVNKDLEYSGSTMFDRIGFNKEIQKNFLNEKFQASILLSKHIVTGATLAFRRDMITSIFPIPKNDVYIHDSWIATLISLLGKLLFVPQALIKYRQHGGNAIGALSQGSTVYPEKRFDRLIFLLEHHFRREKVIWDFFQNNRNTKVPPKKREFLERRINAYTRALKANTFLNRLIVISKLKQLSSIPEFNSFRSYLGNSLIYLFKLN